MGKRVSNFFYLYYPIYLKGFWLLWCFLVLKIELQGAIKTEEKSSNLFPNFPNEVAATRNRGCISRCLYSWALWQRRLLIALMSGVSDGLLKVLDFLSEHDPASHLIACFLIKGNQNFLLLLLDAIHVLDGGDHLLQSDVLASDVGPSFPL